MDKPKFQLEQLVRADDNSGLIIGEIVGVEWSTKVSEYNRRCGAGFEDPGEDEDMWLYQINAVGRKKLVNVYEDDIRSMP